jgi:hypothetical protein
MTYFVPRDYFAFCKISETAAQTGEVRDTVLHVGLQETERDVGKVRIGLRLGEDHVEEQTGQRACRLEVRVFCFTFTRPTCGQMRDFSKRLHSPEPPSCVSVPTPTTLTTTTTLTMSTHFRPRAPTVPSSPVRPSTAHSTIRAVSPSPPDSLHTAFALGFADASPLPRPKSEHGLGSKEMATFARYVLRAENEGFEVSPMDLRRGSATSPLKATRKRPMSTPVGCGEGVVPREEEFEEYAPMQEEEGEGRVEQHRLPSYLPNHDQKHLTSTSTSPTSLNDPISCPDTPTPIPLAQQRAAYLPLGTIPPSQTSPSHRLLRKPIPPPRTRITSNALSTTSQDSIFRTPGRDELERKKTLVEVDDGPFARVTSMTDLDEERRRISGEMDGERRRVKMCGVGCAVM